MSLIDRQFPRCINFDLRSTLGKSPNSRRSGRAFSRCDFPPLVAFCCPGKDIYRKPGHVSNKLSLRRHRSNGSDASNAIKRYKAMVTSAVTIAFTRLDGLRGQKAIWPSLVSCPLRPGQDRHRSERSCGRLQCAQRHTSQAHNYSLCPRSPG